MSQRTNKKIKIENYLNVFNTTTDTTSEQNDDHNSEEEPCSETIPKVLVILAGGTIIMTKSTAGYQCIKGGFVKACKAYPNLCDQQYQSKVVLKENQIITPYTHNNHRIQYDIYELDEVKDSSNYNVEDQLGLAKIIEQHYKDYDSFIILHGTDTMSYTASSLSFIMENLTKSVILTGSQIPLQEMRTDAYDNFLGSLVVASFYRIPEVMIYFDHKLIRGNRSTKISTDNITAFNSFNLPYLGEMGTVMKINWNLILQKNLANDLQLCSGMNTNISIVVVTPFLNADMYEQIFEKSQGIILEAYGAGNLPMVNKKFMDLLEKALENGKIIVVKSQCNLGAVTDIYETGKYLVQKGAVLGTDMTKEAVLAKLSYLLEKKLPPYKIRLLMTINLKGELTEKLEFQSTQEEFDLQRRYNKFNYPLKNSDGLSEINKNWPQFIYQTIQQGNLQLLQQLQLDDEFFKKIEKFEINGKFPIHIATIQGQEEILNFLIQKNFYINQLDSDGNSPLFYALKQKNRELIFILEQNNARLIISSRHVVTKFLHQIAFQGDIETLTKLKNYPIDLDNTDFNNKSMGHIAAQEKNFNILFYLAKRTTLDFQQKDFQGQSVYDLIDNEEVVKELQSIRQLKSRKISIANLNVRKSIN